MSRRSETCLRDRQVLEDAEEVGREIDETVALARTIVTEILELSHGLTVSCTGL